MDVSEGLGVRFLARRLEHKLIALRNFVPSAGELRSIIGYCRRDRCEDVQILNERSYHSMVEHIAMAIVTGPLREGDARYADAFEVLNDAENDRLRDDFGVAFDWKRAHEPTKVITAQHNIQLVSGNHPPVEQAWAKARAEIERLQARNGSKDETLEEKRVTNG